MGLLIRGSQGHVDRGQGQGFKAHSDSGMAARPQAGQSQSHHRPRVQEAGGQENGVVFPGRRTHLQQAGDPDVPGPDSLPAPWAVSTLAPTHTCAATGGLPPSLSSLLTLTGWGSGPGGSTRFSHLREPPCHLPYPAGLPAPHWVPSTWFQHFLIHSKHPQCPPMGTGGMESTETLPPCSGSQAGRGDGHNNLTIAAVELGCDGGAWGRGPIQPRVEGIDGSQRRWGL